LKRLTLSYVEIVDESVEESGTPVTFSSRNRD